MKGFPWIQFYPRDWVADTRSLTLAAKGAWIDILAALHNSETRGELTLEVEAWARLIGSSDTETGRVISELGNARVAEIVTLGNGRVTVKNRRMLREEKAREKNRQRVQRHREKANHTELNHSEQPMFTLNGNGASPDRSQKPEARSHIIPSAEAEKNNLKKEAKPRQRNVLLDALVVAWFGTLDGVPNESWSFAQRSLRQIKEACPTVTADEITRRWENMKLRFEGECSPASLVKWWPTCGFKPSSALGAEPYKPAANQ